MIRHLRMMWVFARYQQWTDEPDWTKEDGASLTRFLSSRAGVKLKASLLNGVLRQQNSACINENNVDRHVGYANGFRGCVSHIEGLAQSSGSDEEMHEL